MQVPFEIKKAALQKALGIGAASGAAFAAAGLFDPEEGEAATKADVYKVIRDVNRSTAGYLEGSELKKRFGRFASKDLQSLKQIPDETISDMNVKSVPYLKEMNWGGMYEPATSTVSIPKVIQRPGPSDLLHEAEPNYRPASSFAHEVGHHWQGRQGITPINLMQAENPDVMAAFLPNSVIPEVLGSKSIPSKVKNQVVDIFHSMYSDPDEVAGALQELHYATKTNLSTPGEVLAAVYDLTVTGNWSKVPTAKKYFEKLGKYMLAVPSVAALAVGIDTALQETEQGGVAEAMPIGKMLKAGTPLATKVVKGDVGVGGLSKVMNEARWFTFPAGPYKGETVESVIKSKNAKTFYLQFESGNVGRLDKEEAQLLAKNLGIQRYLDLFEARSPDDAIRHAKKIAATKSTRNALLAESEGGVPAAAEATPIETLEKVHKMGLEIKPYKQVEYKGQIFDLPVQYANLLLAENIVTIPGEKLMLTGSARARAARGQK